MKNTEKKRKVTLTLDSKLWSFLDTLPRTEVTSKSSFIDSLIREYSCSLSGSVA